MCGIAGMLGQPAGTGATLTSEVPLASLAHRGPDDAGSVAFRSDGPHTSANQPFHSLLLHRRLSILDLSAAGHQPMASADGAYTIVFNGEIYNYREIRSELQNAGGTFRTQTDTEVLLQAYASWGPDCLRRLIGMFAFGILDRRRNTLFLARDFFGIKPLYYVQSAKGFAFASEIKALLDWLPLKRTIDPARLLDYLRCARTDHGTSTMWSEIKQVPAAHYFELPLGDLTQGTLKRYWNLPDEGPMDISFEDAAERVRQIFLENVRLHLRSDVPIGAALSGGIDSSAIVCGMRRVEPSAEIHAFSYIADDPEMSEEAWVDMAGKSAGAFVHKIRTEPDDLVADLDRLIYTQDEPFGSTSIYAQYRVFRLAHEHGIKVMLDGQGADELLAGYRQYVPARLGSLLRQGRWVDACQFANRASQLPGMRGRVRLWMQAGRLLLPGYAHSAANRWLWPSWLNADWFRERGVALFADTRQPRRDMLHEDLRQSVHTSSLPMLLRYEDRNSMAASIESRVPFLTAELADFVLRLPESYLLSSEGTSKNVFRRALRDIVPDAILDRRDKIGFATPEQRWLKSLRPWIERTLASDCARGIRALNVPAMQRDWGAVLAGRARFDFRIWRWVNLIRWAERFQVDFGS